ncbi:hypothetical protein K7X08_006795 [Anisodus acutangulus]|uniref:Uncharacterized protein n=1 Tax=Anisodus acutangulus TaxID=402998 RepID=A0A9Q1N0F1_9SOLA|nr:hypothetical protein K7X08_006795 [Anisodus acutangulus]
MIMDIMVELKVLMCRGGAQRASLGISDPFLKFMVSSRRNSLLQKCKLEFSAPCCSFFSFLNKHLEILVES